MSEDWHRFSVHLFNMHSIKMLKTRKLTCCRSGLAVTCLTAVWEDRGSNRTVGMFFVKTRYTALGHGLHTLTAVPRSTQPSTLRDMVKWVSAFGLSNNNKWRWWVWLLAAYRLTRMCRLAWSGVGKIRNFQPISRSILKTVQGRTKVVCMFVCLYILIVSKQAK